MSCCLQSAQITYSQSVTLSSSWRPSRSRCLSRFIETSRNLGRWVRLLRSRSCCVVILKLPVKRPCVLPGVLPVNGADTYHPRHCNHQSSYLWTPNVWMNILLNILLIHGDFNVNVPVYEPWGSFFNEYPQKCNYTNIMMCFCVSWWLNMNVILQPPYRECVVVCKVERNSGSRRNVFWWVCLHDADA